MPAPRALEREEGRPLDGFVRFRRCRADWRVREDVVADIHAFVTDGDALVASDDPLYIRLRFVTERASTL